MRGKPALIVATDYTLYLGNESDQEVSLSAMELCGFNVGSFETKAVAGACLSVYHVDRFWLQSLNVEFGFGMISAVCSFGNDD